MGRQRVTVLENVNLHIAPREYVTIAGPSGSGKSTLMNLLGCLDSPTQGKYYLAGQEVSALSDQALARVRGERIGFVFQGFQLIPRLTAVENVALPLLLKGVEKAERLHRAQEALARVGLSKRLEHRPYQLSGGQQQRVAVARALIHHPSVILADEPTGNLDGDATHEVLNLLEALHGQGHTLVIITHDPAVARRAPRQLIVKDGQVSERDGSADGLQRRLQDRSDSAFPAPSAVYPPR